MKIALVGNQNSGKTTLFNLLTGSNQKIGNWPGVTIEQKSGIIKCTDNCELVDLPGIYSLSPYTLEEDISRKFVYNEKLDLIINIIDVTSIERSLYLTTQLMELDTPIVVVLNMIDNLSKKGITIDTAKLAKRLGVDVFAVSALKSTGIDELLEYIRKGEFLHSDIHTYDAFIEEHIHEIEKMQTGVHKRFAAVKMLENDSLVKKASPEVQSIQKELIDRYGTDVEEIIAAGRYDFIQNVKEDCVTFKPMQTSISDKLDKVFLNKWAAIPIFVAIMAAMYVLSVGVVGGLTVDLIGEGIDGLGAIVGEWLADIGASAWAVSLVVDGMFAGVGAVLSFVPQLMILFLCIAILETSGYMSRIAFVLDRIFRKIGLSGKALIPFIIGSGCSVPAIMTTRTIEDEQERRMSIILTPFIPCSAKLPIIALFTGFFFDKYAGLVSVSLYFLAIIIIVVSAVLMRKLVFKNKPNTFISELPEFKFPNVKFVLKDVLDKTLEFIKRAGSIILVSSVVIWFLLSFDWSFNYGVGVDKSILGGIGYALAWIFYPILGVYSPMATVSAIQGIIAKEQVVSSMTIIAGLSGVAGEASAIFNSSVFSFFTPASAFAFMAFNLFSVPCISAIAAMGRELGSKRRLFGAIVFQTGIAWVIAVLIRFAVLALGG